MIADLPDLQRKNFIAGTWRPASVDGEIAVENPATEEVIGAVPRSTAADGEAAVAAAAEAAAVWAKTPPSERARYLGAMADGLQARADEIGTTIAMDVGTVKRVADSIQALLPVIDVRTVVDLLPEYQFEERVGNSVVVKDPVGVVAAITPWNYPLHQVTAKIAPALAAGCTVVVKPSEVAPLSILILASVIEEVGLPAGVVNFVFGTGPEVGEALVTHPDVDMVSFTGSLAAGRRVSALASESVKRVVLELGGKSANVLLPGVDLAKPVKMGVANAFLNQGQTCSAWTRMIVSADQYDEAVELARDAAETYQPGPPLDPDTRLGPLVSGVQRDRVRRYIETGQREGARLVTGGAEPPADLPVGYYVAPTVFADVTTEMTIAQEEIFGPVLSMLPYDTVDDALRIANDSIYGLAGGVWGDEGDALEFARRMRTGQVDINGGRFNPLAPFGGFKQSGHGRELGVYGLEEFLQPKSLQV